MTSDDIRRVLEAARDSQLLEEIVANPSIADSEILGLAEALGVPTPEEAAWVDPGAESALRKAKTAVKKALESTVNTVAALDGVSNDEAATAETFLSIAVKAIEAAVAELDDITQPIY